MTREDIVRMAQEAGFDYSGVELSWESVICTEELERFAALVASAEREKLRGQIETLHAMYELASKQRDYLMDQQRAQVASIRGSLQ